MYVIAFSGHLHSTGIGKLIHPVNSPTGWGGCQPLGLTHKGADYVIFFWKNVFWKLNTNVIHQIMFCIIIHIYSLDFKKSEIDSSKNKVHSKRVKITQKTHPYWKRVNFQLFRTAYSGMSTVTLSVWYSDCRRYR